MVNRWIPSGIAMEIHPFLGKLTINGPCSIAILTCQRVPNVMKFMASRFKDKL